MLYLLINSKVFDIFLNAMRLIKQYIIGQITKIVTHVSAGVPYPISIIVKTVSLFQCNLYFHVVSKGI